MIRFVLFFILFVVVALNSKYTESVSGSCIIAATVTWAFEGLVKDFFPKKD